MFDHYIENKRSNNSKAIALLLFVCACLISNVFAMDARTRVGLNLVPAFAAAQVIEKSSTSIDVWLVYQQLDDEVKEQEAYLRIRNKKQGSSLSFVMRNISDLPSLQPEQGTMLVAVQRFDDQGIDALLAYSATHHLLTYSPYAGDVERGVMGGVLISDRIVPLINVQMLKEQQVQLKTFFLKVSVHHGE